MRRFLVIVAVLLSACGKSTPDPPAAGNQATAAVELFESGDAVSELLQKRVQKKFQGSDNFQVYVTEGGYPIGTIMREGSTVGINRAACNPAVEAGTYKLPSMFNTIAMTGKAAFELGLDGAVAQLARFGVKAGQDDTFELSVANAAGRFLLDDELTDVIAQPNCSAYLKGKTLLLVRGYVTGQRKYLLQRARNAGADIGVTKIGNLKVDASSNAGVSLSDEAPTEFLQIVSKVSLPEGSTVAVVAAPTVPRGAGRVFVQRDTADSSGTANEVKTGLAGQEFNVVPQVEAIESRRMPDTAEVRYFNRGDEAEADKALSVLRRVDPKATKRYIGLNAPDGQLEVWLPKKS